MRSLKCAVLALVVTVMMAGEASAACGLLSRIKQRRGHSAQTIFRPMATGAGCAGGCSLKR